ncbi:Kinesin-like protein kif7 [Neolecta irregularis DAH-3]|uniref:Kinesin-like protein kif7 n=1 Tax=Neolecta irregularis (strain DAH-3) TaxID=1198029 RepID=A0A1U7LS95_NEOID|nr:Kinesin-like protein kif7 [Neolecta irregularis DAH-3]|eukprot:OLL25546.1 Kinesin-like protein kif7 [Neolecta irregularis DAH-3]
MTSFSLLLLTYYIYNEQLRDLLADEGERTNAAIREDTKGNIFLSGLREIQVRNVDDLLSALDLGSQIRQTDATNINAQSSRSHAVFSVNLVHRRPKPSRRNSVGEKRGPDADVEILSTVTSKLHFVDLAGSERLKNTGAIGERAKEGISINAGLAALGKVISQLSSRNQTHISYRDSKLTRLLQDSLGGNAITYMIACINPAEYHSSETLNTVQYAQRARAIQLKPQIQELVEEADLRDVIEKLRAEISALRKVARQSNLNDCVRLERNSEREIELQSQLLDLQENYAALGNRHAKLISDLSKHQPESVQASPLQDREDVESVMNRIQRSTSFAEAVEQVILEYEKTIQTLESTLSSTRATLCSTESILLEKESKLASIESLNANLHARIAKLQDREQTTEAYLQDLEGRLGGHVNGEERQSEIISELRREISRLRSEHSNGEAYIMSLEERLAEQGYDLDYLQNEVDRLEKLIERQRGLGKLDSLLHELGEIQQDSQMVLTNGKIAESPKSIERALSSAGRESVVTFEPESTNAIEIVPESPQSQYDESNFEVEESENETAHDIEAVHVTAETSKLTLQNAQLLRELSELRIIHKATANELDQLSSRYKATLAEVTELQDQLDESKYDIDVSPLAKKTFLVSAGMADSSLQRSSSQSLSLELSQAGISQSGEPGPFSPFTPTTANTEYQIDSDKELSTLKIELDDLKAIHQEKVLGLEALHRQHAKLADDYYSAQAMVEELQREIYRAKKSGASNTPVRRKTSQILLGNGDKIQRALDYLQRQYLEAVEDEDSVSAFQHNLGTLSAELVSRKEQIEDQESDIQSLRSDINEKSRIIAGLRKERSNVSAASLSVTDVNVNALEDRLLEKHSELENLQKNFQEAMHREAELNTSIEELTAQLQQAHNENSALSNRLLEAEDRHVPHLDVPVGSQSCRHQRSLSATSRASSTAGQTMSSRTDIMDSISDNTLTFHHFSQLSQLQEKLDTVNAQVQNTTNELEALHLKKNHEKQAELEAQKTTYESQLEALNSTTATLEAKLGEALKERCQMEIDLSSTLTTLRDLEVQHAELIKNTQHLEQSLSAKDVHQSGVKVKQQETEIQMADLQKSISELTAALSEALKANEEGGQKRQNLEESIEFLQQNHSRLISELKESHASILASLASDAQNSESTIASLRAELGRNGDILRDQLQQIEHLKSLVDETAADRDVRKSEAQEQLGMVELCQEKIAGLNYDKEELNEKIAEINSSLEYLRRDNIRLITEVQQAREKLMELEKMNEDLTKELDMRKRSTKSDAKMIKSLEQKLVELENRPPGHRSPSFSTQGTRRGTTPAISPPPSMPLPPLPSSAPGTSSAPPTPPPIQSGRRPSNAGYFGSQSPTPPPASASDIHTSRQLEEQEHKIVDLKKQLSAEKQLTRTLESALEEAERGMKQLKNHGKDLGVEKNRLQDQLSEMNRELENARTEAAKSRHSMQMFEQEKIQRAKAEAAKTALEERMNELAKQKKGR